MSKNNLIYALRDPETQEIRYVGKSTKGLARPRAHGRKYSLSIQSHKNGWIKSLLAKGLDYEIVTLEENILIENLNDREKYWVAYYKEGGANLTNLTDGGEGTWGYVTSDDSKQKMAEKRRAWFKDNKPTETMLQTCFKRKENIIIDGVLQRDCSDCKQHKNLEDFAKNSYRYDGLATVCKTCQILRMNEYRKENPAQTLSDEDWQKSYDDRKEAMRQSVINAYKNDPSIKEKQSKAKSKSILQCEITTGKVIKEYASALEAKKAGFANSNIGQAIKYKKPYRGFMWRFK